MLRAARRPLMQQNIEINTGNERTGKKPRFSLGPTALCLIHFLYHCLLPTPALRVNTHNNILPLRKAFRKNNYLLPWHKEGWDHHYSWPPDRCTEEMIQNHLNCLAEDSVNSLLARGQTLPSDREGLSRIRGVQMRWDVNICSNRCLNALTCPTVEDKWVSRLSSSPPSESIFIFLQHQICTLRDKSAEPWAKMKGGMLFFHSCTLYHFTVADDRLLS